MNRRRETRAQRRKRVIRNRLIAAGVLLVLIILVIVLIVSCGNKKKNAPQPESIPAPTESTEIETTTAPVSIPNEKPVNIYTMNYGDMTCYKTSSITRAWTPYEDLESFGAF